MVALRPARPADVPLLRRWERQSHVVSAHTDEPDGYDPDEEWDWEAEIPRVLDWRELIVAEADGRPVGFVQIIDPAREETHYWGDAPKGLRAIDVWIGEADDLGRGHGTDIMRLALARCFAPPDVAAVVIDPLASNVRAIRFYERLGFRFVERRQFGDDDCAVYRLERADARPLLGGGSQTKAGRAGTG